MSRFLNYYTPHYATCRNKDGVRNLVWTSQVCGGLAALSQFPFNLRLYRVDDGHHLLLASGNAAIWSKSRVKDKPRPANIHVDPGFRPGARSIGPVHTMPSAVISIMRYEINYTIILLSAIWGLLYLLLKKMFN